MIRLVHLNGTLNALHKTEEDGQKENKKSDPKSVPLDLVPVIAPELRYLRGARALILLFESHKSVAPELELLDLAFFRQKGIEIQNSEINVRGLFL